MADVKTLKPFILKWKDGFVDTPAGISLTVSVKNVPRTTNSGTAGRTFSLM